MSGVIAGRFRGWETLALATLLLVGCSRAAVPDIPTELEGRYEMELSLDIVRAPDPDLPDVFAGTWELELEDGAYFLSRGNIRISGELRASDETIRIQNPPAPEGPFNCGEHADGVYDYVIDGNTISFSMVEEPCPTRAVLIQRKWTRRS